MCRRRHVTGDGYMGMGTASPEQGATAMAKKKVAKKAAKKTAKKAAKKTAKK